MESFSLPPSDVNSIPAIEASTATVNIERQTASRKPLVEEKTCVKNRASSRLLNICMMKSVNQKTAMNPSLVSLV